MSQAFPQSFLHWHSSKQECLGGIQIAHRLGNADLLLATSSMGDGVVAARAVAALQDAGLIGVIAPAFAWPFFRICLNLGLPPLTLWEAGEIRRGDRLRVDLNGQVVKNLSSGTRYPIRNLSDLYVAILACGGMAGYVRALRTEHQLSLLKADR